jgi:hypothetical protein
MSKYSKVHEVARQSLIPRPCQNDLLVPCSANSSRPLCSQGKTGSMTSVVAHYLAGDAFSEKRRQ